MLPHSLNTKLSWLFLLTGCLKVQLRGTPARSSRFQGQGTFPAIVNLRKVAEQRSLKMAFSYDLFITIFFLLKWFYEKKVFKLQKIALCPSCDLSFLAKRLKIIIVGENSRT